MALPRPDEYNQAIQNPKYVFSDIDLKSCQVESPPPLGLPKAYSGNFATIYKLSKNLYSWAVRCFTREVPHLQMRYQAIEVFISKNKPKHFVEANFLINGINVNSKPYPIIKMKWVDGDLLGKYISKVYTDKFKIGNLLDEFVNLIKELEGYGIAHGDLQHGNIIIENEKLFLIDYDGMFLPELASLKTNEIGHPNYQHPGRTVAYFNEKIDRFSAITIYLALKAIAINPDLWTIYNNRDNLLFKSKDFKNPSQSNLINQLLSIRELKASTEKFIGVCNLEFINIPSLQDYITGNFNYSLPSKKSQSFSSSQKGSTKSPVDEEAVVFNTLYKSNQLSAQPIENPVIENAIANQASAKFIAIILLIGIIVYSYLISQKL